MSSYLETLKQFQAVVSGRSRDRTMASLIIDSPWLPGYAGVDTLDFFFNDSVWLQVYEQVMNDLPGVVFVPGAWVELGMAAEPSGWGVPVSWRRAQPPGIEHYPAELKQLAAVPVPDPEKAGLMPMILNQYERMKKPLDNLGLSSCMAACRGPLAIASHLHGVTDLLLATQVEQGLCHKLFDKTTDLCIAWLKAQLKRMDNPIGILVLDDIVGLLSPEDADKFAIPRLKRIFDQFKGLIKIFHNDSPNVMVFPGLATTGMDVFNFSHMIDPARAREMLGPHVVLMGNLPPLELLVRGTPDQVGEATKKQLDQLAEIGPMLISLGGGVSPGTPIENLQAMAEVVGTYRR